MTRRGVRTFVIWLLAMAAGGTVVWNSRFAADMSFFLPAQPRAEQQALIDQLKEGVVSRLLMVAIGGGDASRRAALSRDLRARLVALPNFVSIQNGEIANQEADRDYLFRHRYLLSPAVDAEHFSVAGLAAAISDSIDLLASPADMLIKPLLPRDPTGELFALVSSLNAGAQPNSRDGVWVSRDGERAMLLLQTRALGSDTDGQEAALQRVRDQFAESVRVVGLPDARLDLSGPGLFAVQSRAVIKHEIGRLSLISTAGIVILLLITYRSLTLVSLGLLPVISGALAGVVAVSLAYGTVFGITVGFGTALIGEAVDYSIYFFLQSGRAGPEAWRARFWPTIRLGVLASTCGFGALLFSGFPGLAQLGLYAIAGLVTAAAVTRLALPQLCPASIKSRDIRPLGTALAAALPRLHRLRWPALAVALLAAGILLTQRADLWNANLSALSTVSQADSEIDMALRADIGAPDSRYMVVIAAGDQESALRGAETTGQLLDALIVSGVIGGYDSPARFLPSQQTQADRRASLPTGNDLRARLPAALSALPLAATKLEGFINDVEVARQSPAITRATLNGTNLALAVDALLLERPQGWSALLPLRAAIGEPGVDIDPLAVRAALAESASGSALFIDMKAEFNRLYSDYLQEAIRLSLAGFAAIIILLAGALRSPRRVAAVLLPLILTVLIVIAGLHLLGERLHLLHLVGMLLIVAVGSNYALFFDRATAEGRLDPETLASMLVANLTTAIGFGTLALSKVPVLHAIGITVGPGAILAMVFAAMFFSPGRAA